MRRLIMALLLLGSCGEPADTGFQGYVEGEYLRIAAPEAGWITAIAVTKGAQVTEGAALFTLDPARETAAVAEARSKLVQAQSELADLLLGSRPVELAAIAAQVTDAEANLNLARLTLDRQERLVRSNVVAQAQVDTARATEEQAQAQLARAQAQLATARLPARTDRIAAATAAVDAARHAVEQSAWQLAQRSISSPASALVDDVARRVGEYVPAGGVVVSLLEPDAIKVVFFVPEPRRAEIRPDAVLAVACTGCPAGLTARVSRIASSAEYTPPVIYSAETRAKLVFRIEALLPPGPRVPMPGQPATVMAAK